MQGIEDLRSKFTYANVMSTLAAFLALAGGTTAIALSGKNSVKKGDIAKNAVRAREIAKGAVLNGEVKNETLLAGDIAAGAIGASELLDSGVGTAEILNGSVGTVDQADVPAARIQRTTNLPVAASTVVTVPFDEDNFPFDPIPKNSFDPNDMWSAGDPEDVFVPVDGLYLVTAKVQWEPDDTNDPGEPADRGDRELIIGADSFALLAESKMSATRFVGTRTVQEATGLANLAAGEDVSVAIVQRNEDASTVDAERVVIEIVWIGPGI